MPAGVVTSCTEASLRAAMAGGGTVTFACDGIIALGSTITNASNTVLDATGHQITISGGNSVRIFHVSNTTELTCINVTLANGRSPAGAAVYVDGGSLKLLSTTVQSNTATSLDSLPVLSGTEGGGLCNYGGTISATNCVFRGNSAIQPLNSYSRARPYARGGAVCNGTGEAIFVNCIFTGNLAAGSSGATDAMAEGADGLGGAIFSGDSLRLLACTFLTNSARGGNASTQSLYPSAGGRGGTAWGGAVYAESNSIVDHSVLIGNSATGGNSSYALSGDGGSGGSGNGGAICGLGQLTLRASSLASNRAQGGNGGASAGKPVSGDEPSAARRSRRFCQRGGYFHIGWGQPGRHHDFG